MAKEVLVLVDDLFFSSKICSTARLCGVPVQVLKTREALICRARPEEVKLIIVDLNGKQTQPIQAIQALATSPELGEIPILAYFSHVQTQLHQEAQQAGARWILPRSVFSDRLAMILTNSEP